VVPFDLFPNGGRQLSICRSLRIPAEWCWDYSNAVLSCASCNGFCNRYRPTFDLISPDTLEDFYGVRDKVFAERKQLIAARHEQEREFFDARLWESAVDDSD
jgi:hypothetical protein